jgi:hypothetical protein
MIDKKLTLNIGNFTMNDRLVYLSQSERWRDHVIDLLEDELDKIRPAYPTYTHGEKDLPKPYLELQHLCMEVAHLQQNYYHKWDELEEQVAKIDDLYGNNSEFITKLNNGMHYLKNFYGPNYR